MTTTARASGVSPSGASNVPGAEFLASVSARNGHFCLESGHHTDLWLPLETLCAHPDRLQPYAAKLASRLAAHNVDVVCGPLVEGAFMAMMVASAIGASFTYAERRPRADRPALFPFEYRLPVPQHAMVRGQRVAIVNDVISAGSAVRGTFEDLQAIGAEVIVIAAPLVLGPAIAGFAAEHHVAFEALIELPHHVWLPADCPLCAAATPIDLV
jgi:orotate phosphoribosyltransferase